MIPAISSIWPVTPELREDGVFGSFEGGPWVPPGPFAVVLRRPEPICSVRLPVGVSAGRER
jgi:hypothetical protein